MTVENLFRVLLSEQQVEIYSHKLQQSIWCGTVKNIPNCFFDNLISSLYSLKGTYESFIIIDIIE